MLIAMIIIESRGSYLIRISSQSEAFLIEGQGKNFTCESYIHSHGKAINNLSLTTILHIYSSLETDHTVVGFPWYQVENGAFVLVDEPDLWRLLNGNYTESLYQLKYKNGVYIIICHLVYTFRHVCGFLTVPQKKRPAANFHLGSSAMILVFSYLFRQQ